MKRTKKVDSLEAPLQQSPQANNKRQMATASLLEFSMGQWREMEKDADKSYLEWASPEEIREFALDNADDWVTGEYEMDEDSEEMFPSYVALLVTPAIEKTIDWEYISKRVILMMIADDIWQKLNE
jgi:hypothetical protein